MLIYQRVLNQLGSEFLYYYYEPTGVIEPTAMFLITMIKQVKVEFSEIGDCRIQDLWSRLTFMTNTIGIRIVVKPLWISHIHLKLQPAIITIPIIANRSRKNYGIFHLDLYPVQW